MTKKSNRKDWFKLWARDIVTSLDWQKMSPAERGAYCSLLFQSWIEWPDCSLPADQMTLKCICNAVGVRGFDKVLRTVLRKFDKKDGRIFNRKLREQRNELLSILEIKTESAKKAGKASAQSRANQKVNHTVDHNGRHKEVEGEREIEREEEAPVTLSASPENEEEPMSVRNAISRMSDVWRELKGAGAFLRKPDDRYGTLSLFKDLCSQIELDLLVDAFRLWAIELGTGDDRYPLNSFVKVADEYLRKVAPVKGFEERQTDPVEQARIDEAVKRQREERVRLHAEDAATEEPKLAPGEVF